MVIAKECMHVFDDALEFTGTSDELESLLEEFVVSEPGKASAQMISERRALWMGLSLFCTETDRVHMARQLNNGLVTARQIAEKVRMPEQYVPSLFGEKYKIVIQSILDNCK